MKMPDELYGKSLLSLIILLLLVLSLPNALSLNTVKASGEYPAIYIEPAFTDKMLTPGSNFTISVKTDYNGSDVWAWNFNLSYNPWVLHGGINKTDMWTGGTNTTDMWTGDNVTKTFITTEKPVLDSEAVYVNQTLMTKPSNYTIKYSTGNITFTTAPGVGANVTAEYLPLTFSTTGTPVVEDSEKVYVNQTLMTRITEKKEKWIGDNVTKTFITNQPVFPGSETITSDRDPFNLRKYVHYTIDYSTGNITFKDAPEKDENLNVHYDTYGDYVINYGEGTITFPLPATDTWTGDGVTRKFSITQKPVVEDSEKVYVNQTLKSKPSQYTIDYDKGEITFISAPDVEVEIEVTYAFTSAPDVGVEIEATYLYNGVNNGDLITKQKHGSATFIPGTFNNAIGTLSLTSAFFLSLTVPVDVTSGPGTLANITFTVVGYGASNITLGQLTTLEGWSDGGTGDWYVIINAKTMPDHIQHGQLINVLPNHTVAVRDLDVPATAVLGELVPINVFVVNEGNYTESVTVTVYNDTTEIGTGTFTLTRGASETAEFSWNTAGLSTGTYTINATATIALDEFPGDNTDTKQIELYATHDVAVTNISAPTTAIVGELVSINVTVANQGSFDENVNLTVSYGREERAILGSGTEWKEYGIINTTTFMLAPHPTSKNVSLIWNTTDVDTKVYEIDATATIAQDDDLSDNYKRKPIELKKIHDVAVTSVTTSTNTAKIGETVSINVTVVNEGTEKETSIKVTVDYNDTIIETQTITELDPDASQTLTFSWDTSNVTAGTYTIKAVATPVPGETDTDDNTSYGAVTVEKAAAVDILIYVAAAGAAAIIIAAAAIYFLKIRKPKPP